MDTTPSNPWENDLPEEPQGSSDIPADSTSADMDASTDMAGESSEETLAFPSDQEETVELGEAGASESVDDDSFVQKFARHTTGDPEEEKSKKSLIAVIIGIVLAVLVAVFAAFQLLGKDKSEPENNVPVTTAAAPSTVVDEPPAHPGCEVQKPVVPVRMQVESRGWDIPVISLGFDESTGAAQVPPPDDPNLAGWYSEGMKPGDATGHAVFPVHTYRNGGAIGNKMLDPETGFQEGDIIKITGEDGTVLCFEYTGALKIKDSEYEYNPDDDVLYDTKGKPELAIIVCDDFDWNTEEWETRVIFYASPIEGAE